MGYLKIEAKNLMKISKQLERTVKPAQKVINRTIGDLRKRAPGWVAAEVTQVYNIPKTEITPANPNAKNYAARIKKQAGKIGVRGKTIDEAGIVYFGRVLTPTHFGMKPKKLTRGTGKKRKRQPVTVEIKKGQRKELQGAFLGSNRGGGFIPFKREGKKAYPVEAIKTLGLPQMVDNPAVRKNINAKIDTELGKRLEHNIKQVFK